MLNLVELARDRSRADFLVAVSQRFLLLDAEPGDASQVLFATAVSTPKRKGASAASGMLSRILPIAKSPGNPYPDRIAVGRARNCDIVVRDPSVSKLHAHFTVSVDGMLELADVGSHNGTRVNGRVLQPNRPTLLVAGDLLQLGNVRARLVDAGMLYDLLRGNRADSV